MTNNPFLEIDKLIMGDIYTSSEPIDNLTILCDDYGSRFGGTDGERMAAEFIKSKLEEYGLSRVQFEPIEYVGWERGEATLEITNPIQKQLDCISLPHSPPVEMKGKVVDMGDGKPDDFDARASEIAGNIVVTTSEVNPKGVKRWVHRGEKYGLSALAGASAFIFVNHYPGYGPATGGIGRNAEAPIPGISISYEDGAFLQRLVKRHGHVTLHLKTTDNCKLMTSWNVIGDLPGGQDPAQLVMIGCHYDGHDISQGASDPASGAVAVMEAARVLTKYAKEMPCTVRFALWGVEEIGLLGSKEYVKKHEDELNDIRFYLNMDAAGAVSDKGIVLNEWPMLESLFVNWSEKMALEFGVEQSVSAHSDHFPFLMAGVPTGGMGSVGNKKSGGRGYGHTRHDTLDKVTLQGLREASALAARLIIRIASADDWPAQRRDQHAVAGLFQSPEYMEEAEIRKRIDEYYAEHYRRN